MANSFLQNLLKGQPQKPAWEQPVPTSPPPVTLGPAAPTFAEKAGFYGNRMDQAFGKPFSEGSYSMSDPMRPTESIIKPGIGQMTDDAGQAFNQWAAQSMRDSSQTLEQKQSAAGWSPKAIAPNLASSPQVAPISAPAEQQTQTIDMGSNVAASTVMSPEPSRAPYATQPPSGLTTVGGAPLSEFLSGGAMPEQGFARAENAMYGDNSISRGLGGDAATKAFQDASAAREARIGFSQRPGVDVPSLAMQEQRVAAGLDPNGGMNSGLSQAQQRAYMGSGIDPDTMQPIAPEGEVMSVQEKANLLKTLTQTETEKLKQAGLVQEMEERGIKAQGARTEEQLQAQGELRSYGEQLNKLTGVRDEIAKVTKKNWATEGGLGWLNATLPLGSDARTVSRLVKEIEGSTFIRGIIDAKNRGATFGPLSDQEGANIVAAYGKILTPDMKNEQRVTAINDLLSAMNEGFNNSAERYKSRYQGGEQVASGAPQQPSGGTIPNVEGVTIRIKS